MSNRGRRCSVCSHDRRPEIEVALGRKRAPLARIAKRYQLSEAALSRHRSNHMEAAQLRRLTADEAISPESLERLRQSEADGLINQLVAQRVRLFRLADAAAEDGDIRAAVQAEKAVTAALRLTAEALNEIGAINKKVQVNILATDDFAVVRSALMSALREHPDAKKAVTAALARVEAPVIEAQPCS